jgi:preprotein translocase subunit SecY
MTGVMPIIFASSIVSFLPTVFQILVSANLVTTTKVVDGATVDNFWGWFIKFIGTDGVVYPVLLFVLIIAFAYFYTQISFDPIEVSNNIKRQGGTIPGIRQGRPTAMYIKKILNKVTLVGALFLGIVAVLPVVAGPHILQHIIFWILEGSIATIDKSNWLYTYYVSSIESSAASLTGVFTFGGTSLLIIVGVVLETFRDLEAQLTMRNYKGFL